MRRYKTYINGEWFEGTSEIVLRSVDPSNNKELGEIVQNSKEDVEYAIESASRSFYKTREWRNLDVQQRSDKLLKIADMIESEIDEIAKTESMDNGKPLREAQADVDDAVHCFRYYAGLIRTPSGQTYNVNSNFGNMHSYTVKEPVGVCALITPWNFPFLMSVWKIAPALAAGNSIIFKPSSETVLSALKLFEILDKCDLPKGTANLVIGSGSTVGNLLAESKKVDMITFTGSTSVGQGIMRAAAGNVKKIGLELGGKSPNIVFADTDIDKTVEWVMMGIFLNQGEVCCAGSRLIIEKSIKDKFLKKLVERTDKLTLGAPLDNPDMGPLISKKHMQDVLGYIEKGKAEGAKLLCGGYKCTDDDLVNGNFIKPAIFDDCTPDMSIVREEIFGPVLTVLTFETEEEAIELANDTDYGLAGAVFCNDTAKALRVIKEVRAGITWINCYNPAFSEAPWGGYKMSGIGRELGTSGLDEYQETKQININISGTPLGWYNH